MDTESYCCATSMLKLLMVKHILYIWDCFLNNTSKDINDMLYNLCTTVLADVSLVYSFVHFVCMRVYFMFFKFLFFSCVFMCVSRARFL